MDGGLDTGDIVTVDGANLSAKLTIAGTEDSEVKWNITGSSVGDDIVLDANANDAFTIDGAGGNDTITGGAGDDNITGNAGSDDFVFTDDTADANYTGGADSVTGFTTTEDKIQIDTSQMTGFDGTLNSTIEDAGLTLGMSHMILSY